MKSLKSVNLKVPSSISPMAKWIVTIVILGIGVVLVVFLYAQENSRNSQLKGDVDSASAQLLKTSSDRESLEARLVAANLGLAELTSQFPSSKQTMDVEETLFKAAADAGVEITSINCPEAKAQQVDKNSYQAYSVSISITGSREDLLKFVGRLGYWLPSAGIDSVSMGEQDMSLTLKVYAGVGD